MAYMSVEEAVAKIQKVTGVPYTEENLKILKSKGGMCILACAGSGKTTQLTHTICIKIMTGEIKDVTKLLVTTYSVAGKDELEERINALVKLLGINLGKAKKVEVRTLHSAYYMMLKEVGSIGRLNTERSRMIGECLTASGVRYDEELLQKVDSIMSYQVNNMLTDSALAKEYVFDIDMDIAKYTEVALRYRQKKVDKGVIDFDDMQTRVYALLKTNEKVREYYRSLWQYFYIDEAQDVSKIQFEIQKMLMTDINGMVWVGDDDQSIYEWRGASPEILQNICGYYDISSFVLSTNFRCGKTIVDHAYRTIRNNSNRTEKEMSPAPNKCEGKIVIEEHKNNFYAMSKSVADYIYYLMSEKGVEEKDIAVLCRNNKHGVIVDNMVSQFVMPKVNEDMKFAKNNLVKDVRNAIELSKDTYDYKVAGDLWKYVQYLAAGQAGLIASVMKDNACSVKVAIKAILYHVFAIMKKDDTKMLRDISTKYRKLEDSMKATAVESLSSLYDKLNIADDTDRAIEIVNRMLNITVGFLYVGDDVVRTIYGIADYMLSIVADKGLDGYDAQIAKADSMAAADMKEFKDCITISTMHGSKGKQWKYTIILADDNICLPSFGTIKQYAENGLPIKEISSFIEQERRLHYVAMTRAEEELRVYTVKGQLSVFMAEAIGILEKVDSQNSHILDIVKTGGYKQSQSDAINAKLQGYKDDIAIANELKNGVRKEESDKKEEMDA